MYKIHNFAVLDYERILYRPLDCNCFVEFCFTTTTDPSRIQPELFDRYVFAFMPFGSLTNRYGNQIYLTGGNITIFIFSYNFFLHAVSLELFAFVDVIGVLREWGPLQDKVGKNQGCNPQLRKIVIADLRYFFL